MIRCLCDLYPGNLMDGIKPQSGYSKEYAEQLAKEIRESHERNSTYVETDVRVVPLENGRYAIRDVSKYQSRFEF